MSHQLIQKTSDLARFVDSLSDAPYVAVDTEFMRERTYYPQVCLIQVAHGDAAAAIDPLAQGIDMTPLWKLLDDTRVVKVLHSAGQDMEVFMTETGRLPAPVFDTQIAATVCGMGEQPGYATLVSKMLGIEIDKGSQTTDWARRPLTDRQLAYAISDVTHLCVLYDKLGQELARTGRDAWVAQEMEALGTVDRYLIEPREAWRRIRMKRPDSRSLAVLRELAAWREQTAIERDMPRPWLARDEALAEIAQNRPRNLGQLSRVRGLKEQVARGDDGKAILEAVRRGMELPEDQCPPRPPRNTAPIGEDSLVALLQALLRLRCDEHGVAMRLVANKDELQRLAGSANAEAAEAMELPSLSGWRREVFGTDALALLDGRLALTAMGGRVAVR